MGKYTNLSLGISLAGLCLVGWCNFKEQNKNSKLEIRVDNLKKDSTILSNSYSGLFEKFRETSNALAKISDLYDQNLSENEKLNKKVSELSKRINKENSLKGLEGKYNSLANKYNSLKNEKDNLFALYQKEISKNQESTKLLTKNSGSSDSSGSKGSKSSSVSSESGHPNLQQSKETKKKFNAKNQNFFRDWKSIPPRLFSVGEESVSFKDNNSKGMEAFARYETGRLIPLKKIEDSDKSSSFYLPYIDFKKGTIFVYAIDKDGNTSKEYPVYILDSIVSKKKVE